MTRIYKVLKKLNSKRTNNSINKLENELNKYFLKKVQIANKYIKKYSTSLAIKKIQIKTTLRFYLIPPRMAIITNSNHNKYWQG
jgi:hypothetical protein